MTDSNIQSEYVDEDPGIAAGRLTGNETQWQLIRSRFFRHKLAVFSCFLLMLMIFVGVFADFVAPRDPHKTKASYSYAPPQKLHFIDVDEDGSKHFRPFVYGYSIVVDPAAMRRVFTVDEEKKHYIKMFHKGPKYKLWGKFPMTMKFITTEKSRDPFYVFGADRLGRDVLSRVIYGT